MSLALRRSMAAFALASAVLAGCVTDRPAPVVDRSITPARREPQQPPETYVVRRGDTLYSIAFRFGLDYKTVARWNDIGPSYTIYPGQELRFEPGDRQATGRTSPARTEQAAVRTEPLPADRSTTKPAASPRQQPAAAPSPDSEESAAPPGPPAEASRPPPEPSGGAFDWQWPADGELLSRFAPGDPSRNGIDIGGKSGAPIRAAAAGDVVYSGSGLIGYGELIIVKHDNALLSAYGHNRKRLVKEGDQVQAGQQIAEMGQTGAPRAMLHFEIREDGTPVDPMKYLPGR